MDERQIPRCYRTLISDKATNFERRFIARFIQMCTEGKYSVVATRYLDNTSKVIIVDVLTTDETYSVIRSQLSDLYPGLCVFNALIA